MTLCGALLGRIHLSGHIDRMKPQQRALVAEAVGVYKTIRADLAEAVPLWPLGLPRWTDSWIAMGLRTPARSYLLTWRRGPQHPEQDQPASYPAAPLGQEMRADHPETELLLPHLHGRTARTEVLFPSATAAQARWEPATGQLTVALPKAPAACLIRLQP